MPCNAVYFNSRLNTNNLAEINSPLHSQFVFRFSTRNRKQPGTSYSHNREQKFQSGCTAENSGISNTKRTQLRRMVNTAPGSFFLIRFDITNSFGRINAVAIKMLSSLLFEEKKDARLVVLPMLHWESWCIRRKMEYDFVVCYTMKGETATITLA